MAINTNDLFDAVSIITENAIKKYKYDQTIEAKIVSTIRRAEGIYKVEFENGKFDAYTYDSQTYYENETVYVMIPEGDLTKQKYIVGRKVTSEDGEPNNYSFNFKMPFDNFVPLENLTQGTLFSSKGYLANHPKHGIQTSEEASYLTSIRQLQNEYNALLSENTSQQEYLKTKYNNVLSFLDNHHTRNLIGSSWLQNCHLASSLDLYVDELTTNIMTFTPATSFLENFISLIQRTFEITTQRFVYNNNYKTYESFGILLDKYLLDSHLATQANIREVYNDYTFVAEDYELLKAELERCYEFEQAKLNKQYQTILVNYNQAAQNYYDNTVVADANNNHLWSWENSNPTTPMIETKMGISIDVKTLLGSSRPKSGLYGLRIEIKGILKPTEEINQQYITETVYFTNENMYGNTYAFYEPTTQQYIFDVSKFLVIQNIDIFFWQNHDFWTVQNQFIQFQQPVAEDPNINLLPSNIIIDKLGVYFGLTVDECLTDRVFLYTYDDLNYGYDPVNNLDLYNDYRNKVNEILMDHTKSLEEQQNDIYELISSLETQPGYEWLTSSRKMYFAWVHLIESGPILVNHYTMRSENDTAAFEYWESNSGSQLQWYHYEHGCGQDTTVLAEAQGGPNWKYLGNTTGESFNEYVVVPNINKAKEQWKAIVTFNSVPLTTEPLVFFNIDTSVETESSDMLNEIAFRLLREDVAEDGTIRIIEDNTLRDFFVYDENNRVLKDKDNISYSSRWYYIQVWLRNNDSGEYLPLTYDPSDQGVDVVWNFPSNHSMIFEWAQVQNSDLASAVLAPIVEGASEIYKDRIRTITRKFKIGSYLDMSYTNNTISATVRRKHKIYHPQAELHFGQSGSMGSGYTIQITQLTPEGLYLIPHERFALCANVIEKGKTIAESSNKHYRFVWECLSPQTVITQSEFDDDSENPCVWNVEDGVYFIGNVINGYIRNEFPPVFKVTVYNAADYPISQTIGCRLASTSLTASSYTTNCPTKVEFKSDGTAPISNMNFFSVIDIGGEESKEIYPTWDLVQYDNSVSIDGPKEEPDFLRLKSVYNISQDLMTNNNTVIYYSLDNNGKPNLDGVYSLYHNLEDSPEITSYRELYNLIINSYNTSLQNNIENNSLTAEKQIELETLKNNRITRLNSAAQAAIPGYTVYSLDPYINEYRALWYWTDEMENYYTILSWQLSEGIWVKQAIPFTRNVYSSSLLNTWDGQLLIDEQNNAILAQMISAGTKNSNNTFTGVIMGNWIEKGDSSLDIPGLYGLQNGAQVFGFKTDGTGFIGASGKGRITFDGNKSLISNSDRTMYLNLDPIILDNDNLINSSKGYSQYFLYAESKKSNTISLGLNSSDTVENAAFWARDFINDKNKNYFIVDPNNGVLISGGIIADYGKIGNWSISNNGIYQKIEGNTVNESRYMYLGYPGSQSSTYQTQITQYESIIRNLKNALEQKLANLRIDYLNNLVNYLGQYYKQIFDFDPIHYFNFGWPKYSAYMAIDDTLNAYYLDNTIDLQATLESNYKLYVSQETRPMGHYHYNNGELQLNTTTNLPQIFRTGGFTNNAGLAYGRDAVFNNALIRGGEYNTPAAFPEETTWVIESFENSPSVNDTIFVRDSYYGSRNSIFNWHNQFNNFNAPSEYISGISTYRFNESYSNQINLSEELAHLEQVRNWCKAYYEYHFDAYEKQLSEMLQAGIEEIKQTAAYEIYLSDKENYDNQYLLNQQQLKDEYAHLIEEIESLKAQVVDKILAEDKDKYAIYAGYTSNPANALFTVNWQGVLSARAGSIGKTSPWIISDYGLIQTTKIDSDLTGTEKFSTIFIGDPKIPNSVNEWTDSNLLSIPNLQETIKLLPNHGDNAPSVLGYLDRINHPTKGNFSIYAGTSGASYRYRYNESTNQFDISMTTDPTINFGVRSDGTLYSRIGQIGSWHITDWALYSDSSVAGEYWTSTQGGTSVTIPAPVLLLDALSGTINVGNGRTIIKPTGEIVLNSLAGDTSYAYLTQAGFRIIASTQGHTESVGGILQGISFSSGSTTHTNQISYSYTLPYDNGSNSNTVTYPATSYGTGGASDPNVDTESFNTYKIINTTQNVGTQLLTKNDKVVFAPYASSDSVNGSLGTQNRRWDLYGNKIIADTAKIGQLSINNSSLYIGGKKAATEDWVLNLYYDLANKIQQSVTGSTNSSVSTPTAGSLLGGINSGFTGANTIGDNIVTLLDQKALLGADEKGSAGASWPQWSSDNPTHILFPYIKFTSTNEKNGGNSNTATSVTETTFTAAIGVHSGKVCMDTKITGYSSIYGAGYNYAMVYGSTHSTIQETIQDIVNHLPASATATESSTTAGLITIAFKNPYSTDMSHLTINFNQADTRFFKARAFKDMSVGGKTQGRTGTNIWKTASLGSKNFGSTTDPVNTSNFNVESNKYTMSIGYSISDGNNDVLMSGYIYPNVYDAYVAGWRAAASQFTQLGNRVYGPELEPGSSTRRYYDALLTEDTHKVEVEYYDGYPWYWYLSGSGSSLYWNSGSAYY